ncbi:MAG: hypothetical protein GY796_25830 [Chloroflexi bacterium]|nr:hypothetical protein [Chloroflexota bacterium]
MAQSEQLAHRFCRQSPHFLGLAAAVPLLGWLLMIVEYGLTMAFLGADLTLAQTIIMMTAARIAILLPLPGGLGTLEASQVYMLSLLGYDPTIGLSAALLIHARDLLLGLFGLWWGSRFIRLNK